MSLASPHSYRGENTVLLAPAHSADRPRDVSERLGEWCDFFAQGPSEILDLTIIGRTPQRLFDALSTQVQLRRLRIHQGPFDDLARLDGLNQLVELALESATSIRSLEPLRSHPQLVSLELGNARLIRDYSPLTHLTGLRQLSLGSPTRAASLDFVRSLTELRHLIWNLVPEDLDYSPLLALTWVEDMHVSTLRGSRPHLVDLEWALPGIQRRKADRVRGVAYAWQDGERIGDYRDTPDGRSGLYRYDIEDFEPWRA